jgi:hypothetical protein
LEVYGRYEHGLTEERLRAQGLQAAGYRLQAESFAATGWNRWRRPLWQGPTFVKPEA